MDFFCVSSPLCKISILCCCNDTWVPFDRLDLTSSKWGHTFQEDRKTFLLVVAKLQSILSIYHQCIAMAHRETKTSKTNVYPITLHSNIINDDATYLSRRKFRLLLLICLSMLSEWWFWTTASLRLFVAVVAATCCYWILLFYCVALFGAAWFVLTFKVWHDVAGFCDGFVWTFESSRGQSYFLHKIVQCL